jgi:hypothetical protein
VISPRLRERLCKPEMTAHSTGLTSIGMAVLLAAWSGT